MTHDVVGDASSDITLAFPPTLAAAEWHIRAVRPSDYATTRNNLDGAVTRLSPYITHGLVTLPHVLSGVASQHTLHLQHRFVQELGWREFFQHVWQHRGDEIFHSLHVGPLPDSAYSVELPTDIRTAHTGVPVIDQAVQTLYTTGYLHNHARMWLAGYIVHLRKTHWRTGADWMYAHLLDGDLASNHLSWQWIAGTASSKPYLFNADNVARFAPSAWHSPGTVLDTSYEALDDIARNVNAVAQAQRARGDTQQGLHEPTLLSEPPQRVSESIPSVDGRDVWLIHPWSVCKPPASLSTECITVGWWPAEFHARWPWSATRWNFVDAAMSELTTHQHFGDTSSLQQSLAGAHTVHTYDNPHIRSLLPREAQRLEIPRIFPQVVHVCHSFSSWWKHATRGIKKLSELPGMSALEQTIERGALRL